MTGWPLTLRTMCCIAIRVGHAIEARVPRAAQLSVMGSTQAARHSGAGNGWP